jgi:hypothetical protein
MAGLAVIFVEDMGERLVTARSLPLRTPMIT